MEPNIAEHTTTPFSAAVYTAVPTIAQEMEEPDLDEGSKENSAFCGGDNQDKSHQLSLKFAERYNMTDEEFMVYF